MLTLMHLREKIKCNLVHLTFEKIVGFKTNKLTRKYAISWLAHANNTKKALYNKKCNKKTKVEW